MTDRALDDLARRVLLDVCGQEYGDAMVKIAEIIVAQEITTQEAS